MLYVIIFVVGTMIGFFISALLSGGSQFEREERAYRNGYERGRKDEAEKESRFNAL